MKKLNHIVVLLGGTSAEREVSLVSGKACIEALQACGYKVTPLDPTDDMAKFITDIRSLNPDKVFNALHGCPGEDGVFQAILDSLKIPYTHSGLDASCVAMHKGFARAVFAAHGIPIAEGMVLGLQEMQDKLAAGDKFLPLPFVMKPVREGSSVGVYIIRDLAELPDKLKNWQHGDILLEEYIDGKELTTTVMGDKALEVTDLIPEGGFYDFTAKYTDGKTTHICPAEIDSKLREKCLHYALMAHQALGCSGISRTDFRYDPKQDRLIVLEVNTQPGMTPLSLVPEQAKHIGISFEELCDWIIKWE